MDHFTLLIPRRPLSHQSSSATNKSQYKDYVYGRAFASWNGKRPITTPVRMTLIYLFETNPPDINNVIKPIQDALNQLIYADDSQVLDLDAHMRPVSSTLTQSELPTELIDHILHQAECVYVRVCDCKTLEEAIQ